MTDSPSPQTIPKDATSRSTDALPRLRRAVRTACWSYLIASLLLCVLFRLTGDRWWLTTLMMFGPRWIWAVPLGVLIPSALLLRRRSLWVLAAAAVIVIGPFMGLCISVHKPATSTAAPHLRILTCNTQGTVLNVAVMRRLISDTRPDIVAMQECEPGHPPPPVFDDGSWHILRHAEMVFASRFPIREIPASYSQHTAQNWGAAVAYEVRTPDQTIRFFIIHLASPHTVFRNALHLDRDGPVRVQNNSNLRGREASDIQQQAGAFDGPVLLAGDFNLPDDSPIYRKSFSSFTDAFSSAGFGFGWTYYQKWTIARIDHILGGPGWKCTHCWVGPSVGSDHRPLLADMQWTR